MPHATTLSESALSTLRSYRGDLPVTDDNCEACRELVEAGFFIPTRPFVGAPAYRMTAAGVKLVEVLGRFGETACAAAAK